MINMESVDESITIFGRTFDDSTNNSTNLSIPKELAKELQIENSKVSMKVVFDQEGNLHLLVSESFREIVIE